MTGPSSSIDASALRKVQKYGEVMLQADGYFGMPHKYWGISFAQMRRLKAAGHVTIERVGDSTFARPVKKGTA